MARSVLEQGRPYGTGVDHVRYLQSYGGRPMNSVVHFEMPYGNRDRMAKFYESAFGWQTQKLGEDMGNYVLATTAESDANGPREPGRINGGFFPKKSDYPAQYPTVVIAVDDIKESATKIKDAGGKVFGDP